MEKKDILSNLFSKNNFKKFIFFITFFSSLFFIIQVFLNGRVLNDFFWHYKVGEWIVTNHQIPKFGIFSWYAQENNLYWFSHEWLSGVLIYLTSFHSPYIAFCVSILLNIVFMCITMIATRQHIENGWIAYFFYHATANITLCTFFYPRPHVYTFFLLYTELAILYKFKENNDTKFVYFLPIISIIWANIHGGSSNMTYILPIFFIITSLVDTEFGRIKFVKIDKKPIIKLGIITIVDILCLMINPHGYKILSYPFENMNNAIMLTTIQEWQAPDFKDSSTLVLALPVITLAIIILITKKKIDATDMLMFAFFCYLYFRSERFVSLFCISGYFYVFKYTNEITIENFMKYDYRIKAAIFSFIIFIMIGFFCNYLNRLSEFTGLKIKDDFVSDEAIEVIKQYNPQRPYNHYNLGGNLIYKGIDVFIDGRADMYTNHNYADNNDLSGAYVDKDGIYAAEEIINKYNFDMFICTITDKTQIYLRMHPEKYKVVYEDEYIRIYTVE